MKIKKKLLTAGMALALVVSGASMASASVDGTKAQESDINVTQVGSAEEVQPASIFAALGRGVAWGVGWALGTNAASGDNIENPEVQYEDIKESFDY